MRRVKICRADVVDVRVRIPLYEREVWNGRIRRVKLAPYLVAHCRIGEVKDDLRAAASTAHRPTLLLKRPVGMLRKKIALPEIRHLRLHPEAELESALFRFGGKARKSMREFIPVHKPVAKPAVVSIPQMFAEPEPAVVEDEHLDSDGLRAVHYLDDFRFVEQKSRPFPVVEKSRPLLRAIWHPVTTRPAVEVARDLALALFRVG